MKPIAESETRVSADRSVGSASCADAREKHSGRASALTPQKDPRISIGLLTAGIDKHYAYGLAAALASREVVIDLIGSDELDGPELRSVPRLSFLNLRGDQRHSADILKKVFRISRYYARLIGYAASSKAKIFHILWNNKFEIFDRTLLMVYYKLLGKKVVLTAHNVNKQQRDAADTLLNRLTLKIQYLLADHVFAHTEKMKAELISEFDVPQSRVTVIPYGINNAVPSTDLSASEARQRLGLRERDKTILFFGQITPYKGLDYLVTAFQQEFATHDDYRLIIAGNPKPGFEEYWRAIDKTIQNDVSNGRISVRAEFIPDSDIEIYFKAADVLILPYRHIFQSGILFLGFSFGLPVLVADVGSLKDEIVENDTGFVFKPNDTADLAQAMHRYFTSDLYSDLTNRRQAIKAFASRHHSWDTVADLTTRVYSELLYSNAKSKQNSVTPQPFR